MKIVGMLLPLILFISVFVAIYFVMFFKSEDYDYLKECCKYAIVLLFLLGIILLFK